MLCGQQQTEKKGYPEKEKKGTASISSVPKVFMQSESIAQTHRRKRLDVKLDRVVFYQLSIM